VSAWRATAEGVVVACRLTPKGGRDAIDGLATLSDGSVVLACRVRAAPQDGEANAALCRLVAEAAGVAASRARIATGAKSRIKQVAVAGDAQALIETLKGRITPST
jgi:uncharacterized protein YggU (UPF0235/DUF167 family)